MGRPRRAGHGQAGMDRDRNEDLIFAENKKALSGNSKDHKPQRKTELPRR